MRSRDFLSTISRLAERHHPEDQLSDTFCACFNASGAFRNAIVGHLNKLHNASNITRQGDLYRCVTQEVKNKAGVLVRYDIVIRAEKPSLLTFTLESKLGAPLTKQQLKKYQNADTPGLTVITKRYPDVPLQWLDKNRIPWLRWRDVYRTLKDQVNAETRSVDGFLCNSFCSYLEERNMSFRPITNSDLKCIANVFRLVSRESKDGAVKNLGFEAIDNLLGFLAETKKELEALIGAKKNHTITGWGPGYSNWQEDGARWHYLGFSLRRSSPPKRFKDKRLEVSISFPERDRESIRCEINIHEGGGKYSLPPLRSISRFFDKSRHLDQKKLIEFVNESRKHWDVFL